MLWPLEGLRHLDLTSADLDSATATLARLFAHGGATQLRVLQLAGQPGLCDGAMRSVASHGAHLRALDVRGCAFVSVATLRSLPALELLLVNDSTWAPLLTMHRRVTTVMADCWRRYGYAQVYGGSNIDGFARLARSAENGTGTAALATSTAGGGHAGASHDDHDDHDDESLVFAVGGLPPPVDRKDLRWPPRAKGK